MTTKPKTQLSDDAHRALIRLAGGYGVGHYVPVLGSRIVEAVVEFNKAKYSYDMLAQVIAEVCNTYPDLPISDFRQLAQHHTLLQAANGKDVTEGPTSVN
ncbi:MAG: hypothetical protein V3V96_06640 [Acidiferrobacterales bacterium]